MDASTDAPEVSAHMYAYSAAVHNGLALQLTFSVQLRSACKRFLTQFNHMHL